MPLFHGKLEKIWNGWEVRMLIEASLILQVILIIFGARRKFTASLKVRMLVWSAYLVADSVASIALGNLANSLLNYQDKKNSEPTNALQTFWAPFLLLHLGGPDTITAFSSEDSELWLRHLLGLVVQVGVAFYVFIRALSDTALTFLAIPVFITGIIKYGERTFVLRSSSIEHFRDSLGIFLCCISFLSSVSALIVFSVIIDIHAYPKADISFTYSLLVAAVFLEIYAFIVLMLSDWTKVWLIKRKKDGFVPSRRKRWSRSMGQYNLINSWLNYESATSIGVLISKLVDMKYRNLTWRRVSNDLQDIIFKQIQNNSNKVINNFIDESQSLKELLDRRGEHVLKKYSLNDLRWSTIEVEFDHSILVWHIATDVCYYVDRGTYRNDSNRKNSRALSDYMLYLLVFCPSMLQKGISHEMRYRDTYNAITSLLRGHDFNRNLLVYCADNNQAVDTMSVLHDGLGLAKNLRELEGSSHRSKWEVISEVWTEMLTYAASHCAWKEHGQQLGKGGELITHVCLVMAHFGLSPQYRMKDSSVVPDREWPDTF